MKASIVYDESDEPNSAGKIIIAKFEHGSLKKGKFDSLDYTYTKTEDDKNPSILKIKAKDKLSYVSRPLCQKDRKNCRYYVGRLNKKSGKMTIHDAEIMCLKPTFEDDDQPDQIFTEELSYKQQMDRLSAAFGSTKKKRSVISRRKFDEMFGETYSTSMDMSMDHALSQTDAPEVPKNPPSPQNPNEVTILPPLNRDAESPEDVYTAGNMIGSHTMMALKTPAEAFFKRSQDQLSDWTDTHEYPWFILDELKVMPAEENQRWLKAKCLMYLNYLIALFHYKPHNFKKHNCLPAEWPDVVKKDLLGQFTTKSVADKGKSAVRYFPARLKDKLLMHILAMSLVLTGAQLDPHLLIQDVGVPLRKVNKFYRCLGCSGSSGPSRVRRENKGEPTVKLKLPLKLGDDVAARPRIEKRKRNFRN